MEQKLSCAVVKDLLPNYIEQLTSEETNEQIKEHLDTCVPCKEAYQEMKEELPSDNFMKEATDLSRFLRKTKLVAALKTSIMVLLVIGILVCMIVDVAITHKLTWSVIVIASCTMTICTLACLIYSKKHKIIKALTSFSFLSIPLMYVISIYCGANGMDTSWFSKIAIPISLIWIVILWIAVLFFQMFHCSFWICVGILLFLAIPGNIWTNALAEQSTFFEASKSLDCMINSIAYLSSSILCFVIGFIRRGKRI